jgi:hypothetical protein
VLVRNILMEPGAVIRVGDITLVLMKAGDRRIRVGVTAPTDLKITTTGGIHPPVDTQAPNVVGES